MCTSYRSPIIGVDLEMGSIFAGCCLFGSEDSCIFPCHCGDDGPCDEETGECPNGCDDDNQCGDEYRGDWGGPGCQVGGDG